MEYSGTARISKNTGEGFEETLQVITTYFEGSVDTKERRSDAETFKKSFSFIRPRSGGPAMVQSLIVDLHNYSQDSREGKERRSFSKKLVILYHECSIIITFLRSKRLKPFGCRVFRIYSTL